MNLLWIDRVGGSSWVTLNWVRLILENFGLFMSFPTLHEIKVNEHLTLTNHLLLRKRNLNIPLTVNDMTSFCSASKCNKKILKYVYTQS